ncbi:unnamed protein product [Linum trigynum]|uniref:Uncharacterized protein n=1 Tax=Linum trigynum TaxID=586398 RepID=A0AAV2F718_9ROSI
MVLTGTSVTVRSVRLTKWESQTPVRCLRECAQVKKRRARARSEGKQIGIMGQSVKERDWRVERDLRAVKERETPLEKLERWRETTWWNGEDWAEGSLAVGILRDWRARSCFGCSVEWVEVEGDGMVLEGGTLTGEEVGVTAGAAAVVGMVDLLVAEVVADAELC